MLWDKELPFKKVEQEIHQVELFKELKLSLWTTSFMLWLEVKELTHPIWNHAHLCVVNGSKDVVLQFPWPTEETTPHSCTTALTTPLQLKTLKWALTPMTSHLTVITHGLEPCLLVLKLQLPPVFLWLPFSEVISYIPNFKTTNHLHLYIK